MNAQSFSLSDTYQGVLISKTGDSISGTFSFSDNHRSVMAQSENRLVQFNAEAIQEIILDWNQSQIIMKCFRIGTNTRIGFFSIVELSEKPLMIAGPPAEDILEIDRFYTLDKDVAVAITSEKDLYDSFGKFKKQVKDFAFARALRIDRLIDLRDIFKFYNELIQSQ